MLSTLAYVRGDLQNSRSRITWLTLSWALFVMALLCKAVASMVPVALLVLDMFPLRRFSGMDSPRWTAIRVAIVEKLPFALDCLFFMAVALSAKYFADRINTAKERGLAARLLDAGYSAWFYLEKTVWPSNLSAFYAWSESDPSSACVLQSVGWGLPCSPEMPSALPVAGRFCSRPGWPTLRCWRECTW
jgi:hypothetical protein